MNTKDKQADGTLAVALEALAWADGHLNSELIKRAIASVQKALTTPRVNEEVASGEAVAWESTTEGYIKYLTQTRYEQLGASFKQWYRPYKCVNCTTPSPSNVLVEALQFIKNGNCATLQSAIIHASQTLATYSASTDSVTISRSEYEAMRENKARLEQIFHSRPTIFLQHNFDSWIEAIDTARKSS